MSNTRKLFRVLKDDSPEFNACDIVEYAYEPTPDEKEEGAE
jgi:hypothetical protein